MSLAIKCPTCGSEGGALSYLDSQMYKESCDVIEKYRIQNIALRGTVAAAAEVLRRPKNPHNRAENALAILDAALVESA